MRKTIRSERRIREGQRRRMGEVESTFILLLHPVNCSLFGMFDLFMLRMSLLFSVDGLWGCVQRINCEI